MTKSLEEEVSSSTGRQPSHRRDSRDTAAPTRPLPSLLKASAARSAWELKSFCRNSQSLVFTLALPILLLIVFGTIFSGTIEGTNVPFKQYFVAGIIAAGVMSTAFTGLAISVATKGNVG